MSVPGTLLHALVDLVAAVLQFDGDQPAPDHDRAPGSIDFLLLISENEARPFGAGIDA